MKIVFENYLMSKNRKNKVVRYVFMKITTESDHEQKRSSGTF